MNKRTAFVLLIVVFFIAASASADLVAFYTFDDYTANNQAGTAGPAANGSLQGGATIIYDSGGGGAGSPYKAGSLVADLTGDVDYINCGGGNGGWGDLAGDKIVTVMAWYKVAGYNTSFATVVSKGTGDSGPGAWSINNYGTAQDIAFQSFSNPSWQGLPSTNPDSFDGQWHHVAGQFRPEGDYGSGWEQATSNIYVDGVLWNSAQRWGNGDLNVLDIIIGGEASEIAAGNPAQRNFYGYIDDVRIYDEFLDEAAIFETYFSHGGCPWPSTANANGPYEVSPGGTVTLDGNGSETCSSPPGYFMTWFIDDQMVGIGETLALSYNTLVNNFGFSPGVYDITLFVWGCCSPDSDTTTIEIMAASADIDKNGCVNFIDFAILTSQWHPLPLGVPSADIAPPGGDGIVDINDLDLLTDNWLLGCPEDP